MTAEIFLYINDGHGKFSYRDDERYHFYTETDVNDWELHDMNK